MRCSSPISRPNLKYVGKTLAEIEAFASAVNEISAFEKEIKKLVVSAYVDLQSKRFERIFDRASSYPAQVKLICYLSCYIRYYNLFLTTNYSMKAPVLKCVQWVDSVRNNCEKGMWGTLSDEEKKEVLYHLAEMEKTLLRFPPEFRKSKKQVFENSLIEAVENPKPWDDYNHSSRVYLLRLIELLHTEGVAYWHQSRKVLVQDTVDMSGLITFPGVIHYRNWRIFPKKYAVLGLQDLVVENQTLSIPNDRCDFFDSRWGSYYDNQYTVLIFFENDVCSGTISDYPESTLKLDGFFRIDVESLGKIPAGCEASLVFIRARPNEFINAYSVGLMILPQSLNQSVGGKKAVSLNAKNPFDSELPAIFSYLSKRYDEYERLSHYHDDFTISPSMLLDAEVHLEWAIFRPNVAIWSIPPKKFFDGVVSIPDCLSSMFNLYKDSFGRSRISDVKDTQIALLYQGTVYTGIFRECRYFHTETIYFPLGLLQKIYKMMETYNSQFHLYFMISFENIGENIYLLHFGHASQSFANIRKRNPPWQLKLLSLFESRGDHTNSAGRTREIFTKKEDISEVFSSCGPSIMKDYLSDPSSVSSFFMEYSSPEWYIEFKTCLAEYVEQHDKQKNQRNSLKNEPVFVPQKVVLDWDQVQTASDDLNATAELLAVGYANDDLSSEDNRPSIVEKFEESVSAPVLASTNDDDAWQPFVSALSMTQSVFVKVMLEDPENTAELKRLAKQEGKLLDTYFDELNELAVDTFGDVLIDDGEIISEYRSDLFHALKI